MRLKKKDWNTNGLIFSDFRYTSAEHMNDINKKTSVVFGALPEVIFYTPTLFFEKQFLLQQSKIAEVVVFIFGKATN